MCEIYQLPLGAGLWEKHRPLAVKLRPLPRDVFDVGPETLLATGLGMRESINHLNSDKMSSTCQIMEMLQSRNFFNDALRL